MQDFNIVFTPNQKIYNYPRFLVSKNTLKKYITEKNANKVLESIKNQQTNKSTLKFRKYGKIEIYLK